MSVLAAYLPAKGQVLCRQESTRTACLCCRCVAAQQHAVSERRARQDLERHAPSTAVVFAADALLSATSSRETKRRLQTQLGSEPNGAVRFVPVEKYSMVL